MPPSPFDLPLPTFGPGAVVPGPEMPQATDPFEQMLMQQANQPQQPTPNDFFARLAMQTGGQGPFGQFNVGHKVTGLEGLAALLSGFVNGRTRGAAQRVNAVEDQNARARDAAKTLAQWRHDERIRKQQADAALNNIVTSRQMTADAKPTAEEDARRAGLAEAARLAAIKAAGGQAPGAKPAPEPGSYDNAIYTTRNNNRWLDLTGFSSPNEKAAAQKYAAQAGLFPADKAIAERLRAVEETYTNFDDIEAFAKRHLVDSTNPVATARQAAANTVAARTQSDPDIAAFQQNIQLPAIRNIQALAGGMGTGFRLTEAEVNRAINNIPKITDNQPTALRKLKWERNFLASKERTWFQRDWRKGAAPTTAAPTPDASGGMTDEQAYQAYLKAKGGS